MHGHPNRLPFEGCLTLVDVASDKAPSGSRGHRVILSRAAAEAALPSLMGMAVDYKAGWDGHDARQKCGIITSAELHDRQLMVAGYLYARPRRGEIDYGFQAQIATAFGLPGSWSTLDVTTIDVDANARELTFPANLLGIAYNEAVVTYTAGFVTVPVAVKVACAQIVKNAQATPALNVKSSRLDTMQMQYFSGSLIDPQVEALLAPFRAERLG